MGHQDHLEDRADICLDLDRRRPRDLPRVQMCLAEVIIGDEDRGWARSKPKASKRRKRIWTTIFEQYIVYSSCKKDNTST